MAFLEGLLAMKCPFCQFENEDGALFCEQCKSDLGIGEPIGVGQAAEAQQEHQSISAMPEVVHSPPAEPLPASSETAFPVAAVIEETVVAEAVAISEVPGGADIAEAHIVAEQVPAPPEAGPPPAAPQSAEPVTESTAAVSAGQTQADGTQQAAAPAEPGKLPADAKPKLVVLRGQRVNVEYPIYEGDNYIGRSDEKAVDVDLEDQEPEDRVWSSRQHAVITLEEGKLAIEDLNSTNGTFVNRTRLHPGQKRPLQTNDVIQIGTVQMKVQV
jgi:hypothetical protein